MSTQNHQAAVRSALLLPKVGNTNLPVSTLTELLALDSNALNRLDSALMNLLCAQGLPGAEALNILSCLRTLADWTKKAQRYTKANAYFYERNPAAYYHHRGFAKLVSLAVMLKRGLGIRYQPSAIGNFDFRDSRDDLLHGILTRKLGTCASLPVLVVAIGRRLGYPVYLAIARGHVFCQWLNADSTHLNFEISGNEGDCSSYGDEHYHNWPYQLTRDQLASGRFLRPLTSAEELSLFLATRGHCLCDNGRYKEAAIAYKQAQAVAPEWSPYADQMRSLMQIETQRLGLHAAPALTFGTIASFSGVEV